MQHESAGYETVAHNVLRVHRAGVNLYVVLGDEGVTLIDAGLPGSWRPLMRALRSVGAGPKDIRAVVLTHGHFDHVGLCDRLQREYGVPVYAHADDVALVRHPYRYDHEQPRWRYPFRHPAALRVLGSMTVAGALWVSGVTARGNVVPDVPLNLPGRPRPVASPGHTNGHCGFLLHRQGVLFTGDALVTLDPYSGREGPRMVARAATADVARNTHSLGLFAATDAAIVLPGHGRPFTEGIRRACELAQAADVA